MPRRREVPKRKIIPDPRYGDRVVAKFTNGAGTGPTEFWRVALQSPSGVAGGANLAVAPPGYLFATASGSTLSMSAEPFNRSTSAMNR